MGHDPFGDLSFFQKGPQDFAEQTLKTDGIIYFGVAISIDDKKKCFDPPQKKVWEPLM